jgi:predicted metal-dependent HD superfamily phosphohydrolase
MIMSFTYEDSYTAANIRFLETAYGEPTRYYHNMKHIRECVGHLRNLLLVSDDCMSISREALIWHDVFYDPHKSGGYNEVKSAQLFALHRGRAWAFDDAKEVCRLIELTASHVVEPDDVRGQIVVSMDLLILGSPPTRYREYVNGIRDEYVKNGVCSEADFVMGRKKFLASLLNREVILPWKPARICYETQARANVSHEFDSLGGNNPL